MTMDNPTFKPCFIIPCYNHGAMMPSVLAQLQDFNLPCVIVNDGSDEATTNQLNALAHKYDWITLVDHAQNQGKGAAVLTALREAKSLEFTHGLQVDADGQHHLADIPRLLKEAEQFPESLISGRPIYDESVPTSRLYARYITHVWVWIETLSLSLKDSMCGFRVYPIEPTLTLADRVPLGLRMDFDTEVMVRLYWQGTESRFIPTKVIYPVDGVSHFDVWRDNLAISWMHTRLFLAMLPRLPKLIWRHFKKPPQPKQRRQSHNDSQEQHWSEIQERKGLWGIRLMVKTYQRLGRPIFSALLYPVISYFWLTGTAQRNASKAYLEQLSQYAEQTQQPVTQTHLTTQTFSTFRHFQRFGQAMLDKLAAWLGDIRLDDIYFPDKDVCVGQAEAKQGLLILGSHLGDLELCRALGELNYDVKINALVFTKHAARFNQVMQELNPSSTINLIQVDTLGPDTAILLKQKLDDGEWVAIVGDRTSANPYHRDQQQSFVWADFLGKPAPFPQGPFALAAALRCPVYLMFGLKPNNQFHIYFEKFADPLLLLRANRQEALQQAVQRYANRLEHYCLLSPLDWFNFYDFWHQATHDGTNKNRTPLTPTQEVRDE